MSLRVACLAVLATSSALVIPCCIAYESTPMHLANEKVVIVWDSQKKRQHFVRQASFEGEADDFGFIVPTPTVPEVAEADAEVFDRLGEYVQEQKERERRSKWPTEGADAMPASSAEVIDVIQVGDYQATIIKADNGADMTAWLEENDYTTRPAMEPWLDHYAQKGWIFTALKFIRPEEATTPETTALRLSFDAEEPHYPYKMPTDTWPEEHIRPLALYFISDGPAKAEYTELARSWEADLNWTGAMDDDVRGDVARLIGLEGKDLPLRPTLTSFINRKNDEGYDHDLHFSVSPLGPMNGSSQWIMLALGAAAMGGAWWMVRRRGSRAETASE